MCPGPSPSTSSRQSSVQIILIVSAVVVGGTSQDDDGDDYDTGEDEERIEDGMRIEPFNLRQEREEGYFDAEGNYVEYRNDNDTKDAWLESVEVDIRFAGKALLKSGDDSDVDKDLSKEEIGAIKRRIADALEGGETVLRALRRLKGMAKEGNKNERMSGATKILFDQLTEDAMKLLDNGDYNVYEEKKEVFQREAEGYEALTRLRSGGSNGATSVGESSKTDATSHSDMFSEEQDDIMEQANPSNTGPVLPSEQDNNGLRQENGKALDMFGGDDEDNGNAGGNSVGNGGEAHMSTQQASVGGEGAVPAEGSGYVFDESTGYYYNAEVGYYYDANSGLYCSATSGQWYKFNEDQNSYEEVTQ